jgi:putative PIN family toxin of toxin-antitoxin system
MLLVLDTDVIVAALRSPSGASAALFRAALEHRVALLANVALVLEYEAVCRRPAHALELGLDASDLDLFLDGLAALVEPVPSHYVWRPQLRDPGDEMVLEAAVNGGANAIVTFNQRDFGVVPPRFGIELLLPREALRRLQP